MKLSKKENAVIFLICTAIVLLALGVGIWATYLIATSNLPDWVKWFLLR